MSKSAIDYLRHIVDEILFLEQQVHGLSEDEFLRDDVRQRAFARSLEIIGEAIKLIPNDVRSAHPEVDWKAFAGLRDKLIHHYFGVDYQLVWDVVVHELPTLKPQLQNIIADEPPDHTDSHK